MNWNFQPIFDNWEVLLIGIGGTFKIFLITFAISALIGIVVGIGRYSRNKLVYIPASCFVEVFRNTPVLVQIMWFYFAFPIISPFEVDAFTAACLGISLNSGAYFSEIVRGGIQSIETGQWEGGKALGMTYMQQMRRLILPQAFKSMLPALTNRAIEVFKTSTLASTISYVETLHQAKLLSALNFNPIETYSVVAIMFFVALYPLVFLAQRLERRLSISN